MTEALDYRDQLKPRGGSLRVVAATKLGLGGPRTICAVSLALSQCCTVTYMITVTVTAVLYYGAHSCVSQLCWCVTAVLDGNTAA